MDFGQEPSKLLGRVRFLLRVREVGIASINLFPEVTVDQQLVMLCGTSMGLKPEFRRKRREVPKIF